MTILHSVCYTEIKTQRGILWDVPQQLHFHGFEDIRRDAGPNKHLNVYVSSVLISKAVRLKGFSPNDTDMARKQNGWQKTAHKHGPACPPGGGGGEGKEDAHGVWRQLPASTA